MSEYSERSASSNRDVLDSRAHRVESRRGECDHRVTVHARSRQEIDNSVRRKLGDRIHLVRPPQCQHPQPETPGMNCRGQDVGGPFTPHRHNRVAFREISEKKLEGTNLVSSTPRSVEVVALYPEVRSDVRYALNGRGESAEIRARHAGESGERVEKRE